MNISSGSRLVAFGLVAMLVLGACSSAAGPGATSGPSVSLPPADLPSTAPGNSGPDTPIGGPVDPGLVDPGLGQPTLVIARPGQLNPRPVGAAKLEPAVDGHHVLVKVTWWSGVEPCNVLDSVKVERSGTTISIQLIEGTGDATAICIEIAQQKATIVDLGDLDPGTYMIVAAGGGDAAPITVTIQ
jgi:hypothetical protein